MASTHEVTLNQVPIHWELEEGNLSFLGLDSVLFWSNPSLYRMLKPLAESIGVDLFRLMVALESSKGTEEDYHAMVTQLGDTFAEGFLAWGNAVAVAGWGRFELPELDLEGCSARVRVVNPWELNMVRGTGDLWGCPFLQGKIIGIFSHAFGARCWADEEALEIGETTSSVEFRVYAAERTIEESLDRLRSERIEERERHLREAIREATEELEEKQSLIRQLSTPLIQVWDGVLVVPLIGDLDDLRSRTLTESTLRAVSERGAKYVIIDITGIAGFDSEAAEHLLRTTAATRLLGARCLLAGVSARIAQTLVDADTALTGVPCFATTQAALEHAIGKR